MKIIAVYNIKGGVGKTAATVNLAYLSSLEGNSTLLIDLDPQAASSFYFNAESPVQDKDVKQMMRADAKMSNRILGSGYPGLDILPSGTDYRKIETLLADMKHAERWLQDVVKPLDKDYDVVFLDCPPGLSLLTENVFRNADLILVPTVPTILSVRTYDQLLMFFKQNRLNKEKLMPFFSMYERRKSMHNDIIRSFAREHKETISVLIPYSSEVEKMGIYRAPINAKRPSEEASLSFEKLWKVIRKKL